MKYAPEDCCILNGGSGAWAFEPLAEQLSQALGIAVSSVPQCFNYLLHLDSLPADFPNEVFIPISSIHIASDKRLTAAAFQRHDVPTPHTRLIDSFAEVIQFVSRQPSHEWCVKFPTGCGASGHRMISADSLEPRDWPRPFIVQEFVRLPQPEVYRIYCAGSDLFGWVARRFPPGHQPSPWVAHARGARYECLGEAPEDAQAAAHSALQATGLYESFGCVDLLRRSSGEWVVLEVGTDGLYNHVDRELNDAELEDELLQRIVRAFWKSANADE